MTRTKLLSILQEETDAFKEQSRLRDDVLDAMEQAYIKGKNEQLNLVDVRISSEDEKPIFIPTGEKIQMGFFTTKEDEF